jgi:hypothetical protein
MSASSIAALLEGAPTDAATSARAQALFRKAWAAFPESHTTLMRTNVRNDVWQMPEMFDYACEVLLPAAPSASASVDFAAFASQASASANVPAARNNNNLPLMLRVLDLAEERNKLGKLIERVEAARERVPDWKLADFAQALVHCRLGRYDLARALLPRAIDALENDQTPLIESAKPMIFWAVGLELEKHRATRDLAFTAYQAGLSDPHALLQFRWMAANERVPARQLVPIALQMGRRDEARRALLDLAHARWLTPSYDEDIVAIIRMIALDEIGTSLVELGFAADAIALYRDAQTLSGRVDLSAYPSVFPGLPERPRLIEEHLKATVELVSASERTAVAHRLITQAVRDSAGEKPGEKPGRSTNLPAAQIIDLMTIVHPRDLDRALVRSLLAESFEAASALELAGLLGPIDSLHGARPAELSVAICFALHALAGNDAGRIRGALEELARLVEQTPLAPLADGVKANARERAEAAQQLPLWLVARACRRHADSAVVAHGDRFAARALEAARRQDDRVWQLAMLREEGQLAFDRKDRASAAATWSRMLEIVVAPPQARPRRGSSSRPRAPAAAVVPR